MAARPLFGRLFPSSLALFPLPKEAGTTSADAYDTQFSSIINGVIQQISQIPTVRVPRNLPSGASKALFSLFGSYQLDQSGASSTHPSLDTFRRLTDKHVFDTYGQNNIIEIGPSLTRMAARPDQCAAHSCSPTLDGRDRARALLAANIAANRPNHPNQADIINRGSGQYGNPIWMCNNKGQDCQVQGRILYSSFSLQDETPAELVAAMRSHGASIAIVNIELPIGLQHVDNFQEADTGAMWKLTGEEGQRKAQCNPGYGDAGYTHDFNKLKTWMTSFAEYPLFAECLFQFGSAVCFRFTLTGDEGGCESYPILLRTMMEKYSFISGDIAGIPDFLTSASHFDRLVAYLTTHHDKFAANLFKAALERVSVLTPAIVLGDDKYTDRWVLTSDQRISVAMAACTDVLKMMHRSTIGQRYLDVVNTRLATSVRRAEASMETGFAGRVLAGLRGEKTITSAQTFGDWFADCLDFADKPSLAQTTALPVSLEVANGKNGEALQLPVHPQALPPPPAPQGPPAGGYFIPPRLGYAQPANAHPILLENWLTAINGIPARRGGRLLGNFDPVINHTVATGNLNGMPVNNLTMLQTRAVNHWNWDPQTCLDMLIVGPAGSGKSTHARRIAPPGTCVIVPTNELQRHWNAVYPGHPVFTLDEAVANINMVRNATAIIIDEVYQFPIGHVITLASLGIPTIALGAPDQRRYGTLNALTGEYIGPLGHAFHHTRMPIDHHVILHTIQRFGQDITDIMNNRAVPIYVAEYAPAIAQNFAFVTTQPGVRNIQVINAQRPGLHLTFHNANTNIFNGTITVDAAQGTDADNVYLHLCANDEVAFAQNPYALTLALSRCRQTVTITVPAGTRNNSPLIQRMTQMGLRLNQFVRRGATVFGSRLDAVQGAFTSLDDLEHAEADIPSPHLWEEELVPTYLFMGRNIVVEDDDENADDTPTLNLITPSLQEAMFALHPEPPQPAELTRDKTIIRFRKPDPACRIRVPEWIQSLDLHEPTIFPHIGYPFSNTEVLASVLAVFDRYTKPQNVAIPNKRAFFLADLMFDNWCAAFLRPGCAVNVPSVASMFSHWFDRAKALRIAQVAEQLPFIDSGRPLQNEYFLKCQCKPKFKAFGFCTECGQGILATNKLLNATTCPLIVQATKIMQAMFRPGVIYDSSFSAEQLDDAVRATGAHRAKQSMSIDLSQQDSSHINVHRYFIAKVLAFLGFDDTIVTLYLMSRARRFCKGLTMLGLLFEVIERLFSGEPGTALFNFLMSTGTTASTFDLSKFVVFLGKGDDNTIVPVVPRLRTAVNMVKETGVTQKIDVLPYLDFANRIWTSTGRSFMDPARALAKYTMRMSKRDNSVNEQIAFADHKLRCNDLEFEELVLAMSAKHKIEYPDAFDIASAVQTLADSPASYFANLRPSKIPVDYLPTLRMSGKQEVVFEDLRDRCAPAAIAFIADVPINDVMCYVAQLRLRNGIHPDVRAANSASVYAGAFFMSADEIKAAAAKFGVRRSGSDMSLKIERQHVVVVRGKFAWRAAVTGGVFGSLWKFTCLSVTCIALAYCYERRAALSQKTMDQLSHWASVARDTMLLFATGLSPIASAIVSIPAFFWLMWFDQWWNALTVFVICQLAVRFALFPFHLRALKTKNYRKVAGVRVEHAAYGTTESTSRAVSTWLVTISLATAAIYFAVLCFVDIKAAVAILHHRDYPSDELIIYFGYLITAAFKVYTEVDLIYAHMLIAFAIGYMHHRRYFHRYQLLIVSSPFMMDLLNRVCQWIINWFWTVDPLFVDNWAFSRQLIWVIPFYLAGYLVPMQTYHLLTNRILRLCQIAIFLYKFSRWTSRAIPWIEMWNIDRPDWRTFLASNFSIFAEERTPLQRFGRMRRPMWTRLSFWLQSDDPVQNFINLCNANIFEKRGKVGREFMRVCHPDKVKNITASCLATLSMHIGTGNSQRPAECKRGFLSLYTIHPQRIADVRGITTHFSSVVLAWSHKVLHVRSFETNMLEFIQRIYVLFVGSNRLPAPPSIQVYPVCYFSEAPGPLPTCGLFPECSVEDAPFWVIRVAHRFWWDTKNSATALRRDVNMYIQVWRAAKAIAEAMRNL